MSAVLEALATEYGHYQFEKAGFAGTLNDLTEQHMAAIRTSSARHPEAKFVKAYVKAFDAICDLYSKQPDGFTTAPEPAAIVPPSDCCAIVLHSKTPKQTQRENVFLTPYEWMGSVIRQPQQLLPKSFVCRMLALALVLFLCCLLNPPLARTPARIVGWCARKVWDRTVLVMEEFVHGIEEQMGEVAGHVWKYVDSNVPGVSFSFGKAVIYTSIGVVANTIFRTKLIPHTV